MNQLLKLRAVFAVVFLAALLWSCGKEEEACAVQPDTNGIAVETNIVQLQDSLLHIPSKQKLVSFLTRHPLVRDEIFRRAEYKDDSSFVNELFFKLNNPHFDTLAAETRKVFGDLAGLRSEFEQAFTNLKYYYPAFTPPRIETVVSGFDTDLYVSDSLIIVSLDFFLGRGAKYRPKQYEYLLRKYDPNDIVPSCMLIYGISPRYNSSDLSDKTVLADMVSFGKAFYFAKHMLPCVPDSVLIWYTPEEIKGSRSNEDLIWKRFVDSQILYSTSHKVKQDYLGERPNTIQVGEKCPGRIGQWVGWQIVNTYAEHHPKETLPGLMAVAQAERLFKESSYKPSH
jgi:hypothetical protein